MYTEGLIASISAVALALSKNLSDDELALLAAVFLQLGDTLTTIAVLKQCEETEKS
ncbi:MAG: hypothetical protein FWD00_02355 [Clostridiales bacterium]|nr:hypothetical protein [Clostridiales bacterium]